MSFTQFKPLSIKGKCPTDTPIHLIPFTGPHYSETCRYFKNHEFRVLLEFLSFPFLLKWRNIKKIIKRRNVFTRNEWAKPKFLGPNRASISNHNDRLRSFFFSFLHVIQIRVRHACDVPNVEHSSFGLYPATSLFLNKITLTIEVTFANLNTQCIREKWGNLLGRNLLPWHKSL